MKYLTLKAVVPVFIYIYRYFLEGVYVYGKLGPPESLNKLGPDLCYMAAILGLFNIVSPSSGLRQFATESAAAHNNPDLSVIWLLGYAAIYIVLWFVCVYLYKGFAKKPRSTSFIAGHLSFAAKTQQNENRKWAITLGIAIFLFIISVNGQ